ncbi:hypothetical protein CHUAL_005622 [Chamberlinius hualienensis]
MASTKIKLNVGGVKFETTRSTIDKLDSGYFNRLLDPHSGFEQPPNGEHFIDRDPECFRIILNIARYGEVITSNNSINSEVLAREAEFYLLGSDAISTILRYNHSLKHKEEKELTVLKSILSIMESSLTELQMVKLATQELVRGMASQAYWT